MRNRKPHHHPCRTQGCTVKVPCNGELMRNFDGEPDVICEDYHLPSGVVARVYCSDCLYEAAHETSYGSTGE